VKEAAAHVLPHAPRVVVLDVNFDVRVTINTGAKTRLSRAIDLGEDDGTSTSAARDLKVGQQALAVATPRRVVEDDEGLGEVSQEGVPARGR
jgi:hypothetical protein